MAGPEGNSEFCFLRILILSENIEIQGKHNSLFPAASVILSHLLHSFVHCGKKKSLKNVPSTRGKRQSHHNHATFCHSLIMCC